MVHLFAFVPTYMTSIIRIVILNFFFLFGSTGWCAGGENQESSIFDQKEITIVITDSGLGGLTVMDDIAKKITASGYYKKVNLIFVNALFDVDKGYNALPSRVEKIDILNTVLYGIDHNFNPDIILIACNTLSVIYKDTRFVKESSTPVIGIIESGVELIFYHLQKNENSAVIITGTETTIDEDNHRKTLIQKGISNARIVTQACSELQSYIEQDPYGENTEMLIGYYIDEALSKIPEGMNTIYLSLNCSHFGYSEPLWLKAFSSIDVHLNKILNPNIIMGDILMPERNRNRFENVEMNQTIHSKVVIRNWRSIYEYFLTGSPGLADALKNYTLNPDLF